MAATDTIKELPHLEVKRCGDCGARFGREATFCPFCGVQLAASTWDRALDPLVGKIVDGRYEVLEPLGEGGMGTVYKVRHITLNRLFAMKALRRDLAADGALSQRFIFEARATGAIKHHGVVSISDFGVLEDGIPYFVMELLVGETLSTHMRARGPMPPRDVIAIARDIADALTASHAANVIHRDLKPENVFLVGGKDVRLVDFGAAKIVGGSKLTRPGVVFGTPYYMSPEQAAGHAIDGRADVYSLGILMFEMLTGRVPFEADTYMGVLTKHLFAQAPKPSEAISGVRLGPLEDVVMRALEKEPSARYASMTELKKALDEAEQTRGPDVPVARTQPLVPIGTVRMSTADRIEHSVEKQLEREKQIRQKQILTTAVATLIAVLGLGIIVRFAIRPKEATFVSAASATTSATASVSASASASAPAPTPSPPPAESATLVAASAPAPPIVATAKAPTTKWAPPATPAKPSPAVKPTEPVAPPAPPPPKKPDDFSDPWQK